MAAFYYTLNIQQDFKHFFITYPFLDFDNLLEKFLLFGGSEAFLELNLLCKDESQIILELAQSDIIEQIPFFLLDEPFRNILVTLALSDAKLESTFIKSRVPLSFKEDILQELIEQKILYIEYSREEPLKSYAKQKIKKELRHYLIQNKLRFTKPFYHFLFAFIIPFIKRDNTINIPKAQERFVQSKNRLISLWFEHLSKELIKNYFQKVQECYSYWDRFSEFDIYAKVQEGKYLIGECKYTHKPITKYELIKLEAKIKKSDLKSDYIAFFSKAGYSKELKKLKRDDLLLFSLEDFKKLL